MSQQQQQSERYNGWANYPTWAVNLWMANDEGLYNEAVDYARDVMASGAEDATLRYRLAEIYREWIRDLGDLDEASFRSDLLGWAFGQVDWAEIATSWLDSVEL